MVLALAAAAACASGPSRPPVGAPDPDKFLFERGTEELNDKDWFTAREYFRQLVDSYPQSIHRGDAKLGIGDTYLGEGTTESYVLAINEFREFLSFYPTHRRAYYAQFKLGDVALLPDAQRDARPDGNARGDPRAHRVRGALPRTAS